MCSSASLGACFFHVIARVRVLPPESMFPCLSVLWAIFGFAVNSIVRVFVSRACLCERIRWSSINKLKQRESSDCNMREERACGGTPQNISIFSCQWTLRLGRWSLVQYVGKYWCYFTTIKWEMRFRAGGDMQTDRDLWAQKNSRRIKLRLHWTARSDIAADA